MKWAAGLVSEDRLRGWIIFKKKRCQGYTRESLPRILWWLWELRVSREKFADRHADLALPFPDLCDDAGNTDLCNVRLQSAMLKFNSVYVDAIIYEIIDWFLSHLTDTNNESQESSKPQILSRFSTAWKVQLQISHFNFILGYIENSDFPVWFQLILSFKLSLDLPQKTPKFPT